MEGLPQAIEGFMNNHAPFSGAVLVSINGKVPFARAYGMANRSENIGNRIETRFGLASGTKIFTAIAICQLVERRMLSFQTRLDNLGIQQFDSALTIHHLLTHTSGIPDYFDEEAMDDYADLWNETPMYKMRRLKDFLPLFDQGKMVFSPGSRFLYNNAGYIVLGLVVERITGMAFTDYIKDQVLSPLDMDDSGFFFLDMLPPRTAWGYIDQPDGSWKTNIYSVPIIGGADGGMFSTAPDMNRFWHGLLNYQLLGEEMTAELLKPHAAVNGNVSYGYGVWVIQTEKHGVKYHLMGEDPGVRFRSSYYPATGMTVIVMGNSEYNCLSVSKGIEDMLLD